VVEAVQAGVEDQVAVARVSVGGRVGVGDVVLALRLGAREQPPTLLDAVGVLGAAALENVVCVEVLCIRKETARQRGAGRTLGKGPTGSRRSRVREDLVPVVRGGRGARRAEDPRGGIAVEFKSAKDA